MPVRRSWTLQRTVHDVTKSGRCYTYRVPRVLRIPGVCTLQGAFVLDTSYVVLGFTAWRADVDDGGSAGFRVGVGLICWEVYVGRLLSRRAVERRAAADLIEQTEQHLRDVSS